MFPVPLPGKDDVASLPLSSVLVHFPGTGDQRFGGLPPAVDCCCLLQDARLMVGAGRLSSPPLETDDFCFCPSLNAGHLCLELLAGRFPDSSPVT